MCDIIGQKFTYSEYMELLWTVWLIGQS